MALIACDFMNYFLEKNMKKRADTKKLFLAFFLILGSSIVYTKVPQVKTVTADQQMKGTETDVEITRILRQQLMEDKALSFYAKNITLVTLGNHITLKGKVKNKEEGIRIEEMVKRLTPDKQVINNLTFNKKY